MPNMRVDQNSGALIFTPTKEEQEVKDIKTELQGEIEEVRALKDELKKLVSENKPKETKKKSSKKK